MRRRGFLNRRRFFPAQTVIVPPLLVEANRLFNAGDYLAAADRYEDLAARGERRHPRRAAQVLVQAGWSRLLGGQDQAGISLIQRGLKVLVDARRHLTLRRLGNSTVNKLRDSGYPRYADQIEDWLIGTPVEETGLLEDEGAQPVREPAKPPHLPAKCPSCGGSVDPREVEWVDGRSVECAYCGSLIPAEEA
jgi:hypothetical protein